MSTLTLLLGPLWTLRGDAALGGGDPGLLCHQQGMGVTPQRVLFCPGARRWRTQSPSSPWLSSSSCTSSPRGCTRTPGEVKAACLLPGHGSCLGLSPCPVAVCVATDRICVPPAGWSWECLQDWGPFFRLAVPSMLMLCLEWWAYEIGSFLSGQRGAGRWWLGGSQGRWEARGHLPLSHRCPWHGRAGSPVHCV